MATGRPSLELLFGRIGLREKFVVILFVELSSDAFVDVRDHSILKKFRVILGVVETINWSRASCGNDQSIAPRKLERGPTLCTQPHEDPRLRSQRDPAILDQTVVQVLQRLRLLSRRVHLQRLGISGKTMSNGWIGIPGLKKMVPSFLEAVAAYLATASRALPAELSW